MPQLWVIAGPNGSGKSCFAERHLASRVPVVSPDTLCVERGVEPLTAGRLAIQQKDNLLRRGSDFAVDTTFSGRRELQLVRRAQAAGYQVNLVFLCLESPALCQARILQRVQSGGHAVPVADVFRRYARSLQNLHEALLLVDRALVIDNSGKKERLLLSMEAAKIRHQSRDLPSWARQAIPQWLLNSKGLGR